MIETTSVIETEILLKELGEFDGCFMTNSVMGIMPVVQIGNQNFISNPIALELKNLYENECDKQVLNTKTIKY